MGKLLAHEKETIISFGKEDDFASVFTYERSWQTHCEKVLGLKPMLENGYGGREYLLPKAWIRKPRKTRTRKKELGRV